MKTIYISSTFKDLQKEREAANKAILRLGHHPICMEDYVACDERPVDRCVKDAASCDIYVGIFAFRYGYIPPGYDKSITHLEYEAAVKAHKPCLIFFVDTEAPFPPKFVADGEERQKINKLREELEKLYLVSSFKTSDELGGLVSAAVSNTLLPQYNPDKPNSPILDLNAIPKIPGYLITGELGKGGMGMVYLGIHEKLERSVAIKVLHPWLVKDQKFAKQFLREAKIAANMSNPHIISIFDVGQDCSLYYIVLEYLTGGSLKDKIQKGPLGPSVALNYLGQMSEALSVAHKNGVIHRDIKSDNIMFRQDGTAVLMDFGIARSIDMTTLHNQDEILGCSPKYMSPEQARGEDCTSSSDIYSLGIVFYEMLVGRVPYESKNVWAIVNKHIQEPLPQLPAPLSRYQSLLNKMLAKAPGQRFLSADKLREMLDFFWHRSSQESFPNQALCHRFLRHHLVPSP